MWFQVQEGFVSFLLWLMPKLGVCQKLRFLFHPADPMRDHIGRSSSNSKPFSAGGAKG